MALLGKIAEAVLVRRCQEDPKRYNPSDTQRDIIWVDDEGVPALMKGSSAMVGIEAGLQVKVSLHGIANNINWRR